VYPNGPWSGVLIPLHETTAFLADPASAYPGQEIQYDNEGISISGDVLDVGTTLGIINKNGNTYSFGEEKLGVGREVAKSYLKANPKLINQIKKKCWEEVEKREKEEAKM